MTTYINHSASGAIRSVDIVVSPDASMGYIYLRDDTAVEQTRRMLRDIGRTIVAESRVDGRPVLITSGPRSEPAFVAALAAKGEILTPQPQKKPFDAWKVRSALGFGGQALQLTSAFMKHRVDTPLLVFATTNMTANGINWAYSAQKKDDPYQLQLLKQAINSRLQPMLDEGQKPLAVEDQRMALREQSKAKPVEPLHDFMQKHSVNVGELGLRYIGALGMAFPVGGWGSAIRERRLPLTDTRAPLRTFTGLTSMFGKTIALTAKVPDPYNPKPRSAFDDLREKYSFLAGGLVETAAFGALAYDAFFNTGPGKRDNSSIRLFGKERCDWLSGVGALMFTVGYIVRSWAKFGERVVDMPELYAHASDMLAMVDPEKRPQAVADTAAYLADHFKGMPDISFSKIYNELNNDLCQSHHLPAAPSVHRLKAADPATPNAHIIAGDVQHAGPHPVLLRQRAS